MSDFRRFVPLALMLLLVSPTSAAGPGAAKRPQPPSNTALPSISGTLLEQGTVTATPGEWSGGSLTFAFRWQRCDAAGAACAAVESADEQTFTIPTSYAGSTLRVSVVATNKRGSTTATSAASAAIAPKPDDADGDSPPSPPPPPPPPASSGFGIAAGCCLPWFTDEARNRELDEHAAVGSRWIRFDFPWSAIEQTQGSFDWGPWDRTVSAVQARGLQIVANIAYTPVWARNPACASVDKCEPANADAYANFAAKVVERFAPKGVKHYELWNEPNLRTYWQPQPDAGKYAALIRTAYPRMKAVDPSITVMVLSTAPVGGYNDPLCTGGANGDSVNINAVTFLERVYAAGGRGSFDAISHHPYADPVGPTFAHPCNAWRQMADTSPSLRSLMIANGDGDKKIWATEYGSDVAQLGADKQAQFLREGFQLWKSYSWAGSLFWYAYKNPEHDGYNLVGADWSRRLAWNAYRESAG